MKQIILCAAFVFATIFAQAQTKLNLEVKSITKDGRPTLVNELREQSFALVWSRSNSLTTLTSFMGNNAIHWGSMKLLNKTQRDETSTSYPGYTYDYDWYSTKADGKKLIIPVKIRIIQTNDGDEFVLDMKTGTSVIQYKGLIIELD